MTPEELKRIGKKIAKCLAMSTSDNPTEAATGMRQAEALLKKYNLTTGDVAAAHVHEQASATGTKFRPPVHISGLAALIADAFGCLATTTFSNGYQDSKAVFMGMGIKPDLAAYTFDVLRRQLIKDRAAYRKTLNRYAQKNRTRMADLFCDSWLRTIAKQVRCFAGTQEEKAAINTYQANRFKNLKNDERKAPEVKRSQDYGAILAGKQAAKDVSLHKPVNENRTQRLAHE